MASRPPKDIDAQMLSGCTGFVLTSLSIYLLSAWPFFLWTEASRFATVLQAAAMGLLPGAVVGVLATRKWAAAGAAGFFAGAMTTSVFLYLRLEQAQMAALSKQAPELDYPASLSFLLPIGWMLAAGFLAVLALPKE